MILTQIDGKPIPKIPQQEKGESAAEYVLRLEEFKRGLSDDLLNARVRGVASEKGILPWYLADTIGPAGSVAQGEKIDIEESLQRPRLKSQAAWIPLPPPHRKRRPQERLDQMVNMLWENMAESYKQYGKVELPESVLQGMARATGMSVERVRLATLEGLREAVVRYAAGLLNKNVSSVSIPKMEPKEAPARLRVAISGAKGK